MLSLPLKTALKASLGGSFAWAICQFLGFNPKLSPLMGSILAISDLGIAWYGATQLTIICLGVYVLGALGSVLWGNNYISIFLFVLLSGYFWRYLQLRGVIGACFGLAIKFPVVIIHANASDPITFAFNLFVDQFIGMAVGMTINQLLWPSSNTQGLQTQLEQFFDGSQKLIKALMDGYFEQNETEAEMQKLQASLLKNIQTSQKLLKIGSYDITGRQLGKNDWMSIIKTEQNLYLHLSAIVRLVQSSDGIELSPELKADLQTLSAQLSTAFAEMPRVMLNSDVSWDLSPLNSQRNGIKEHLVAARNTHQLATIPLSELLTFYGIVHRLDKMIFEINSWTMDKASQPQLKP